MLFSCNQPRAAAAQGQHARPHSASCSSARRREWRHSSPIYPRVEEPRAGEGRLLECNRAQPLSAVIARLKELLGVRHLRLALGVVVDEPNLAKAQKCCLVKTVAIAVGEGAHVLRDTLANVFVTSEMSHTEVLAANARGVVVLLLGRTTMERAFLAHLDCAHASSAQSGADGAHTSRAQSGAHAVHTSVPGWGAACAKITRNATRVHIVHSHDQAAQIPSGAQESSGVQ